MSGGSAPEPRKEAAARPGYSGVGLNGMLTLVVAAAALYFARDVFVPLAIAGLLSFVLSPPMRWLRHRSLGRTPAALAVVTLAFIVILGFGSIVVGEVASLTKELPSYAANLEAKLESVRNAVPFEQLIERGTTLMRELRAEVTPPRALLPHAASPQGGQIALGNETPVPVEVRQTTGFVEMLEAIVGPVLKPLALAGLVLIFTTFFLLSREDLRDRFIRLAGARDLHRATLMLGDAVERLSRYLWTQSLVNASYGALIGIGSFFIGVPSAPLWGVLAAVLRFVPYIGIWIAAFFPLALALAVVPGWSMFFEMLALFAAVELVTSNAVEPRLFGASAGMSPVAVLVAATFWTWLWGPVGLVLSIPLTACLVVIGRYAPPLRFLAVLLGNEAPLTAEQSFYQRLLAGDSAEAAEQAEAFIRSGGALVAFYDQVAIPALLMALDDSERGVLARADRAAIVDTIRDTIESIAEEHGSETRTVRRVGISTIECLGARNELDDAAALLMAQLLGERGLEVRAIPARQWLAEPPLTRAAAHETGAIAICLSHLGDAPPSRLRLLARRVRRRTAPEAHIVFGLWSAAPSPTEARREIPGAVDGIETSLAEAVERIAKAVRASNARGPGEPEFGGLAPIERPV